MVDCEALNVFAESEKSRGAVAEAQTMMYNALTGWYASCADVDSLRNTSDGTRPLFKCAADDILPPSLAISILVMGSSCGSQYRYGVLWPNQQEIRVSCDTIDVDFVCVVPHYIENALFYSFGVHGVGKLLCAMPHIADVSIVATATVPIIKFKYKQTDIDLLMLRLEVGHIPAFFDPLNISAETRMVHPAHIKQYRSTYAYGSKWTKRIHSPPVCICMQVSHKTFAHRLCIWRSRLSNTGQKEDRCMERSVGRSKLYAICILYARPTLYAFVCGIGLVSLVIYILNNHTESLIDVSLELVLRIIFEFLAVHPWPKPVYSSKPQRLPRFESDDVGMGYNLVLFQADKTKIWTVNPKRPLLNGMCVISADGDTNIFAGTNWVSTNIFQSECIRGAQLLQAFVGFPGHAWWDVLWTPMSLLQTCSSFILVCLGSTIQCCMCTPHKNAMRRVGYV